jgi:hypothetical protein
LQVAVDLLCYQWLFGLDTWKPVGQIDHSLVQSDGANNYLRPGRKKHG